MRQLTWQLNMERLPSFMQDGRLVFTSEKREPGFYQLALRRQNLDGSDYHPLYAQRGSIGYSQATYVTELSHKDFAAIFSDSNAVHGAGALGVFNRSIGIDFTSTNTADYLVDSTVINPSSASSVEPDFFLHSLSHAWRATARTRSPSALPDGQVLVSYGAGDAVELRRRLRRVRASIPSPGTRPSSSAPRARAEVEAVAVFPRVTEGYLRRAPATSRTATRRSTPARRTRTSPSST